MTGHTLSTLNVELNNVIGKAREKQKEFQESVGVVVIHKEEKKESKPLVDLPSLYKNCTLDNFTGNEKLISVVREYLKKRESLFITGKTGCGKTHLAAAIVREIPTKIKCVGPWDKQQVIDGTVFITAPELLMKARASFSEGAKMREEEIIDHYGGCDLLCLDDLGAEKTTEYSITTLYLIIDRRIRNEMQTIITTNLSLDEIEATLGARIASRLAEMKIIKINMPDYRKKR